MGRTSRTFAVGNSRLLLELVIGAYKRGDTPEGSSGPIGHLNWLTCTHSSAATWRTLPVEHYLRQCDAEGKAVRRQLEASQPPGPTKDELLALVGQKG